MKAPALVIALGKGKGSEEEPKSEPEMEEGGDEDKTAAAQLVLDAVKANDAEALSEALSAHYAMCGE